MWDSKRKHGNKNEVWLGTLSLMVLRTLEMMGPQHGYGLARRIEQINGDQLAVNYGTLYPALLKLEQDGGPSAPPVTQFSLVHRGFRRKHLTAQRS